jgi:hypothetical protein
VAVAVVLTPVPSVLVDLVAAELVARQALTEQPGERILAAAVAVAVKVLTVPTAVLALLSLATQTDSQ